MLNACPVASGRMSWPRLPCVPSPSMTSVLTASTASQAVRIMRHPSRRSVESGGSITPCYRPRVGPAGVLGDTSPGWRTWSVLPGEDEQVLTWKLVIDPVEPEAFVLHFELRLWRGHLVRRQNRNRRILGT